MIIQAPVDSCSVDKYMAQLEEDLPELMDQIQYVLTHSIVASPSMEYYTPASLHEPFKMAVENFSQPQRVVQQYPGADMAVMPLASTFRPSASLLGPDVTSEDLDNLNAHIGTIPEQIWRSASMSSLSNIFMEQPDIHINQEKEIAKRMAGLDSNWMAAGIPSTLPASRSSDIQGQILQPDVWSMHSQYNSLSATTSSSVSGRGDAPRVSTSPEHPFATSERHASPSNSSSLARSGSSLSAEVLGDPKVKNGSTTGLQHLRPESRGDEYDIQNIMLSGEDPCSNHSLGKERRFRNPALTQENKLTTNMGTNKRKSSSNVGSSKSRREWSPQGAAFKSWMPEPIPKKNDPAHQLLLRRCIRFMNLIPEMQRTQFDAAVQRESESISHLQGPGVTSSPETVANVAVQETRDMVQEPLTRTHSLQGGPRVAGMHAGSSGGAQAGHDEAARNHMMAERRRRNKQKENFATLRRLVPIISKADKASILGDAVVYLKDLEQKYKNLEVSYKDLERRYEELEANLTGGIYQPNPQR